MCAFGTEKSGGDEKEEVELERRTKIDANICLVKFLKSLLKDNHVLNAGEN